MNKLIYKLLAFLIAFILIFITIGIVYGINAFVFMNLWNWFVCPLFYNISKVNFYQSLGIYTLISFLLYKPTDHKNNDWKTLFYLIIAPIVSLFIGFIIHFII